MSQPSGSPRGQPPAAPPAPAPAGDEGGGAWEPRWRAPQRLPLRPPPGGAQSPLSAAAEPAAAVEAAVLRGGAPESVVRCVQCYYRKYAANIKAPDGLAEALCNDYAGRIGELYQQLEARYPAGAGFFAEWDAAEQMLRERCPALLPELPELFSECGDGRGERAALLSKLQRRCGCEWLRDRRVLRRPAHPGEGGWSELARGLYRQHAPQMPAAAAGAAADALLRAFGGSEALLVSLLSARLGRPPAHLSSVPPAADCGAVFAERDRVLQALHREACDAAAALRREAQRSDRAAAQAAALSAAAQAATDSAADAAVRLRLACAAQPSAAGGCAVLQELAADCAELAADSARSAADLAAHWSVSTGARVEPCIGGTAAARPSVGAPRLAELRHSLAKETERLHEAETALGALCSAAARGQRSRLPPAAAQGPREAPAGGDAAAAPPPDPAAGELLAPFIAQALRHGARRC
eukprot:TRINITY_DN8790_c0_g1_i1.p1 TRINITY_DN8790_c0_g1~~TRINITY_DN8790_c0_g1_i1.p1  ORF type:complete len:491 (+),score=173.85 TRINITY_DN8790_c0_g1_i1:68-1474(+)